MYIKQNQRKNIDHMFEELALATITSKKYEKYIDYQSELNSLYQIIKKEFMIF